MKYLVTIVRKEYKENVFEVEADSPDAAEELAYEKSEDFDFTQVPVKSADEEIIAVEEKSEINWLTIGKSVV